MPLGALVGEPLLALDDEHAKAGLVARDFLDLCFRRLRALPRREADRTVDPRARRPLDVAIDGLAPPALQPDP